MGGIGGMEWNAIEWTAGLGWGKTWCGVYYRLQTDSVKWIKNRLGEAADYFVKVIKLNLKFNRIRWIPSLNVLKWQRTGVLNRDESNYWSQGIVKNNSSLDDWACWDRKARCFSTLFFFKIHIGGEFS